jgi:hypothetical protein
MLVFKPIRAGNLLELIERETAEAATSEPWPLS